MSDLSEFILLGTVVEKSKIKEDRAETSLERFIAGNHMNSDDLIIHEWGEIGSGYLGPAFVMRFDPGDTLYGSRRTYLRKVAYPSFSGICANTTLVLRPKSPELKSEFLPLILQSNSFVKFSIKNSKGSTNPYVNWTDLAKFPVRIPSLTTQEQIIEIIGNFDRLIQDLRAYNVQLDDFIQSRIDDYVHSILDDDFDYDFLGNDLENLPSDSSMMRLEELVEADANITYGIVQPGKFVEDGVLLIRGVDYITGWAPISKMKKVTREVNSKYQRSVVKSGDILFNIVGTPGVRTEVPTGIDEANITQTTARIRLDSNLINRRGGFWLLRSSFCKRQYRILTKGSAQPGMNLEDVQKLLIPIGTPDQQSDLAKSLDELSNEYQRVQDHIEATQDLRFSCLNKMLGDYVVQ